MAILRTYRRFRQTARLAGISLLVIMLLSACSGNASPSASADPTPSASSKAPNTNPPTKENGDLPDFDGVVGQDWYNVSIPLFKEIGGAADLAYGAGKLWVVGPQTGARDETYATPALLTSSDGMQWDKIDLEALGIPANLSGKARLLGTEQEIIVLFENPEGSDTVGDVPQRRPWVVRGDGAAWRVIGPEQFGSWQVNTRDSGKYLNYWDLQTLAERNGEIVLMPRIGWFEPYKTGDSNLGLGRISTDDSAEMVADYNLLRFKEHASQSPSRMLVYNGDFLAFVSTYPPRADGVGRFFNIWRSADGKQWNNETPALQDQKSFTTVNDAVIGPGGIVAVGAEAAQKPDSEFADVYHPISLFSADGHSWTKTRFGEEKMDDFMVAATDSAYYAYGEGSVIWHSADGRSWSQLAPVMLRTSSDGQKWTEREAGSLHITKAIGLSEGLIALDGSVSTRGGSILFSGKLPGK